LRAAPPAMEGRPEAKRPSREAVEEVDLSRVTMGGVSLDDSALAPATLFDELIVEIKRPSFSCRPFKLCGVLGRRRRGARVTSSPSLPPRPRAETGRGTEGRNWRKGHFSHRITHAF
jgi:hypothetical protein